jgi:hypothetical protein
MAINTITKYKQSDAMLDYVIDLASLTNSSGYSNYLDDDETIYSASATVTGDDMTISDAEIINDATAVRVWLDGGTVGTTYTVSVTVQTTITSGEYRRKDIFDFNVKCI